LTFYLTDQEKKIAALQGRLSTRDTNPVNPIPIRTKITQHLFDWNGSILLRMKNERVVMAVRTTEVAMGKEKHRTNLPRPIHKGSLQKTLDLGHH
jgi:ribonuclease PH